MSFRLIIKLLILINFITVAYAADDWCILEPQEPPCLGAPGRCIRNSNGSLGGFVADTAQFNSYFWNRPPFNKRGAYLGQYAQLCEQAQISGSALVYGHARISGKAHISGRSRVFGNARVSGNAWVTGSAWVYENGWVSGNARVFKKFVNRDQIIGVEEKSKRNALETIDNPLYLPKHEIQINNEIKTVFYSQTATMTSARSRINASLKIFNYESYPLITDDPECPICLDRFEYLILKGIIFMHCNHFLCKECFNLIHSKKEGKCPLCRAQEIEKESLWIWRKPDLSLDRFARRYK